MPGVVGFLRYLALPFLEMRCAACGIPFVPARAGEGATAGAGAPVLCPSCAGALAPRAGGYCPRCGNLAALPQGEILTCGLCLQTERPWGRFFFHAAYQGLLRELLLRFKNGHRLPLGDLLGRLLAAQQAISAAYDAVVPMPLHPARLRERGFNQALELALPLARQRHLPLRSSFLLRHQNTRPQAGLSLDARKRNVRGVFIANETVAGQRILLVDDIATTCSSLGSAAQALKDAGATAIDVAVVARTPEHMG